MNVHRYNSYTASPVAGRKSQRRYRTTCKLCLRMIAEGDPTRWNSSPMGLVHKVCP